MKFHYEYRTPDNAKHNGVICASDREAAYAELKKQGIKPSRFAEAPGFFNKLFGKGKRWIVIGVLGVLCLVLGYLVILAQSTKRQAQSIIVSFDTTTRRQPIGDQAVIEKGIATGWSEVFPQEGERFLASFAVPGAPAGLRNTTEDEIRAALTRKVEATAEDAIEVRQIKAMVEGMKNELRNFIAAGGSIRQYGRRLVQRQNEEISYFTRAQNEIDQAAARNVPREQLISEWEKVNERLRRMGIGSVPMPKQKEK